MTQESRTASTRSWEARRPHAHHGKQIEKRLRELRNIKRGKPARKPTKKRQQRNRTNKLARPLNPVKKPEITEEPSTTLPPLAPANKEAALEAKKRLASQDAKQASCPDLDSGRPAGVNTRSHGL